VGGQHTRTAIATGTCVTLGLALAVTLGAVPRAAGDNSHATAASLSSLIKVGAAALQSPERVAPRPSVAQHRAAPARAHVKTSAATSPASIAPAVQSASSHLVTAENVSANAAATPSKPATTPAKKHHKKTHHKKTPPKKTAPVKTVAKKAVRTKPSASALASAVSGLKQYVHTIFSITSSEVAEFGNEVCSAFDKNESYSAIKSQITAKVKQLPFTTVTAGAADYVVRTAVKLYCPGYTSRTN
jgi:predicted RecA/RadA family phage recombinase